MASAFKTEQILAGATVAHSVGLGFCWDRLRALPHRRVLVLTDAAVWKLWQDEWREQMSGESRLAVLPLEGGETLKDLSHLEYLYSELIGRGFTREDAVVAWGGGVIGDLAGLAAATYMRGLPFYQLPTTLLAMCDSSIGGKNGINLPAGKNLVGTFYQPQAIWADTAFLRTLPGRQLSCGWAEVLKTLFLEGRDAFAAGTELLRGCSEAGRLPEDNWAGLVARAASFKHSVVAADFLDSGKGRRIFLNFGHTLGHALENLLGYGRITHGEAVALGMLGSVRLADNLGILKEPVESGMKEAFVLAGLPVSWPIPSGGLPAWRECLEVLGRDKKRRASGLNFVLPLGWGEVCIQEVDPERVRPVFESLFDGQAVSIT